MTLEVETALELENFELDVEFEMESEIFALLGKSGAGKSLTLDTVAGFVSPDRGRIRLDDRLLFDSGAEVNLEPDRREVGYVLQQGYLFEHMSVGGNLNYGCRFRDQGPDYEIVLDVLNLKPLLDRSPRNLSGGEKQRVALGRALLTAPRLLLLDEPVSNLDQAARRQILKYVRKVHSTFDLPVLYVSHAYREVEFLTDRIGLIDEGRLSKICQPESAFELSGALTPGQN